MGVAGFGFMAHHTHDVGLISLVIEGVAHGLAVDGQAFVSALGVVPLLQGPIQVLGIDADQQIPEDILTGDDETPVFPDGSGNALAPWG